jgi:hypothetical protein
MARALCRPGRAGRLPGDVTHEKTQTFGWRLRRGLACLLIGASAFVGAVGCRGSKKSSGVPRRDPDVIRYRLPLRENSVDTQEAFRCYGACQPEETPDGYLQCLKQCPGFETTPGLTCDSAEVPPYAVCITARKVPIGTEPEPGWVIVGTVAQYAIAVALVSVCASNTQCLQTTFPPPK